MLEKIRRGVVSCLVVILLPSYGYSMDLPEEKKSGTPQLRSYEFLLIYYDYSKEYILHLNNNNKNEENYKPFFFKKGKPSCPLPEVLKWKKERLEQHARYERAHKDYTRAEKKFFNQNKTGVQKPALTANLEKTSKALQSEQRKALRRHGSLETIEKIKEIDEAIKEDSTKETGDIGFFKEFEEEIKKAEKILYFPLAPVIKTCNDSPTSVVQTFSLDSTAMKFATQRLKKIISQLTKEYCIKEDVCLLYQTDYLSEVSNTWSAAQWANWLTSDKEQDVKRKIKTQIEKKYPYGEYCLRLMGQNPTPERLKLIGPRELALYLRKNTLFCKVKDNEEMQINQNNITNTSGLGAEIFKRLKKVLTGAEMALPTKEETAQMISDQWRLLDFASICAYLPDDFSAEQMSRIKQDRRETLANLLNKPIWGWKWRGDKWEKIIKVGQVAIKDADVKKDDSISLEPPLADVKKDDSINLVEEKDVDVKKDAIEVKKENPRNPDSLPTEEESKLQKVYETYAISNQLVQDLIQKFQKKSGDPKYIRDFLSNLTELKRTINFKDKLEITCETIKPHKQKMVSVLGDLPKIKDDIEIVHKGFIQEHNENYIKEYNKLYEELKQNLIKHRTQEYKLDEPYGFWTYIPTRRTFFASDVPYGEQQPPLVLNLNNCGLYDDSFFINHMTLTFIGHPILNDLEKTSITKPQGLLLGGYKKIDLSYNLLSGQKTPKISLDLEALNLRNNSFEALTIGAPLSNLTWLDISHNLIKHMPDFSNCSSLTFLNLSYNPMKSIFRKTPLKHLRALDLSGNHKLFTERNRPETFQALATLSSLASLNIVDCKLIGPLDRFIATSLTNLCELDVRGNPDLGVPDMLQKLPTIKSLRTDKGMVTFP